MDERIWIWIDTVRQINNRHNNGDSDFFLIMKSLYYYGHLIFVTKRTNSYPTYANKCIVMKISILTEFLNSGGIR